MSTNKTEHLELHSWVPEDRFQRTEINENFSLIDANAGLTWEQLTALQSVTPHVAVGSYVGDGNGGRTVELGFTPKFAVLIGYYNKIGSGTTARIDFVTDGEKRSIGPSNYIVNDSSVHFVEGGIYLGGTVHNINGQSESYFAIG